MTKPTTYLWSILAVLLLLALPQTATAQSDELADALKSFGISDAQITVDDTNITIAYHGEIESFGPWEAVLFHFANIIAVTEEHSSQALPVVLRMTLPDGHVMQITGTMADAAAFREGSLTPDEYEQTLVFQPVTRGPVIIAESCAADQGQTCLNAEACSCYPNESCKPDDAGADARGCVVDSEPANATLENGHYGCNEGYVWNAASTDCELPQTCPSGTYSFNGECVSQSDSNTTTTTDYDDGGDLGGYSPLGGFVGLCGTALCVLIPVAVIAFLVIRRRKRRRSAEDTPAQPVAELDTAAQPVAVADTPAQPVAESDTIVQPVAVANTPDQPVAAENTPAQPTAVASLPAQPVAISSTPVQPVTMAATPAPQPGPVPIPPPPLLTAPFRALEQRHAELKRAYTAGQMDRDAYHQALRELVVQDERGHWAYSSGEWMWFDGSQWVLRYPE